MPESTPRVERRGGRRTGPDRVAKCGHSVPYHPGPLKKMCLACRYPAKACPACGVAVASRRKYCSLSCRKIAYGELLTGPRDWRVCALPECDVEFEPFRSGVRCCSERHGQVLWNRESRADGRQTNAAWGDRRRQNYQARRARMLGAPVGRAVFLSRIVERDGFGCGICGEPVDFGLEWPHPLSKSVDHVIPLSRGGMHDPANCQLAHLRCNTSKGARVA